MKRLLTLLMVWGLCLGAILPVYMVLQGLN